MSLQASVPTKSNVFEQLADIIKGILLQQPSSRIEHAVKFYLDLFQSPCPVFDRSKICWSNLVLDAMSPANLADDLCCLVDQMAELACKNDVLTARLPLLIPMYRQGWNHLPASAQETMTVEAVAFAWGLNRLTETLANDFRLLDQCLTPWRTQFPSRYKQTSRLNCLKFRLILQSIEGRIQEFHRQELSHPRLIQVFRKNVRWAMLADLMSGHFSNVKCGYLINRATSYPERTGRPPGTWEDQGKVACFGYGTADPLAWNDLYVSWNLAFVAGYFQHWPLAVMKLLIPATSDYRRRPTQFVHYRAVSLFLFALAELLGGDQLQRRSAGPYDWRVRQATLAWGRGNVRAMQQYFQKTC